MLTPTKTDNDSKDSLKTDIKLNSNENQEENLIQNNQNSAPIQETDELKQSIDENENIVEELSPEEQSEKDEKIQKKFEKLKEKLRERPKMFILEEVHARYEVLRAEFLRRGWKETTKKSVLWNFKWTYKCEEGNTSLWTKRIVNHFYNCYEVGTKSGLLNNLRRLNATQNENIFEFMPRAYLIQKGGSQTDERHLFVADFDRTQAWIERKDVVAAPQEYTFNVGVSDGPQLPPIQFEDDTENIWILKPSNQARGVGIKLFQDKQKVLDFIDSAKFGAFVVQKYIENPLIIKGKKFDIRQFVLVTGLDPLTIWILDDCYLRFCTANYNIENIENQFIHLTNHQVQKRAPNFRETEIPESQWSLATFRQHLTQVLKKPDTFWDEEILPKIERLVITALKGWPKESHRNYNFELLGFDILLDHNFRPFLMEINTNPGLHMLTEIVKVHHTKAQLDLLKVVLDERNSWFSKENPVGLKIGAWRLIYKEQKAK
jgi:hypothetical protein